MKYRQSLGLKDPTWLAIQRDLELGPATEEELVAAIRMHPNTIRRWMIFARSQKVARIVGYERHPRHFVRVWGLGSGADYRRPKADPTKNAERCKSWRQRNPEKAKRGTDRSNARAKARRLAAKQQARGGLGGAPDCNQEQLGSA